MAEQFPPNTGAGTRHGLAHPSSGTVRHGPGRVKFQGNTEIASGLYPTLAGCSGTTDLGPCDIAGSGLIGGTVRASREAYQSHPVVRFCRRNERGLFFAYPSAIERNLISARADRSSALMSPACSGGCIGSRPIIVRLRTSRRTLSSLVCR